MRIFKAYVSKYVTKQMMTTTKKYVSIVSVRDCISIPSFVLTAYANALV